MKQIDWEQLGLTQSLEQLQQLTKVQVHDQNGLQKARCHGYVGDCSFNGSVIKAMTIGAVSTAPELRRSGIARNNMAMLDATIREQDVLVSYLHPFSFPYYRTMGYERVADHRILEFNLDALEFLPRYTNLEPVMTTGSAQDLEEVYNTFSQKRNVMIRRYNCGFSDTRSVMPTYMHGKPYLYQMQGKFAYLSRDDQGRADGYMILRRDMPLREHYLIDGTLHVEEMCFTTNQAMYKLLGFLRVFEGEYDHIRIVNCGMAPEVERALRKYKYTKITVLPDVAGRVHDVEGALKAVVYPRLPGEFTVRVTDCPGSPFSKDLTEGTWHVAYANGNGTVTRVEDNAPCDLCADVPAFTQLIHGFESYGALTAAAMHNVTLYNDCDDFFRAFPNRPCGSFELY